MIINPKYKIGEIVYFITDPMQDECMVVGYQIRSGYLLYIVSHRGDEYIEQEIEITNEKQIK